MTDATSSAPAPDLSAPLGTTRDRFYLGMAIVMVTVNFIGFAPSYFLKGAFETPTLPLRTHIHGIIFSSWFILFTVQTALIHRRNVRLHRRLGIVGVALLIAMAVSALVIVYVRAIEYSGTAASLANTTTVVWGNLALLILFVGFAGTGIALRRRTAIHRRLMLLASLAMMPQALGRIGRMPAFQISDTPLLSEIAVGIGGLATLLAATVVHDFRTRRRPHPVTLVGVPLLLVGIVLAATIVPGTGFAQGLILRLN